MGLGLLRGAVAGAAGTTALNAATYLDMGVRGRASSSAPQVLVEAVAGRADVEMPGKGDERGQRLGRSMTLALTRGRGYRFRGGLLTAAVPL
jgi:hypothetical protein